MKFELNNVELEHYNEFIQEHCGNIEVIFTNTGIGTLIEVHCKGCGCRKNISDYSAW